MAYTKMGLDHYKTYFDINYPFGKYDQLLVPDFNIGAMENVAAVTFAEFVIQKGPSNRFERQRRADIILHEMAHMWFGNLVTKNWWNGLWLNESFASLMASIATSELPEFKDFWHDFYLGTTLLAIDADNKVSTHPIEMPVPSTNDFFSVFDTITYEKGSSVLNQLSHLVGQENFRLGVSKYLKKHAWSNTELIDFIAAQSEQSGQDLEYWSEEWLYQAGVNSIAANFQCDQGNVTEFKVLQTASEELPTLRSQLTQLALFDPDMNISFVKAIKIVGASTDIAEVIGKPCPYMVFPNYQGWGYVEVKLDEVSKGHIIEAINKSNDPMLRSMLWTTVFSESDIDFEQVIHALDSENNDRVIGQVQRKLIEKLNLMERQGRPNVMTVGQSIESLLWRKLNTAGKGDSLSMIMLQDYVNVVRTASGQNNLLGLLSGNINLPEVTLSQDNRWSIIHRMAVLNHKNINDLLDHETMNDPSDGGKLGAIAAEAALPDLANKKAWIKQFMVNENAMPFSQQRVAMENLFPANQTQFQEELLPDLVAALPVIGQTRDNYYQRSYAESLFHGVCSDSAINTINTVLDKEQLGTTLYRFLSENLQLAQECLAGVNQ
ncbi:MAG: M1 family aminopeptidase, partial [Marinicella sp.]